MSGDKDYHKSRFSIVSFVIGASNVTSPYDCSFRMFSNECSQVKENWEKMKTSWKKGKKNLKTIEEKSWGKVDQMSQRFTL